MFCWLIPSIYKEYPKFSNGNDKLINLIVSSIDAKQLQELICKVLQGAVFIQQRRKVYNIFIRSSRVIFLPLIV